MRNSYKDEFNEWASQYQEWYGRDPDLEACKSFDNMYIDGRTDLADAYRDELKNKGVFQ